MALNPVTRLSVATITLFDGRSYSLVHDLDAAVWARLLAKWGRTSNKPTVWALIEYVKKRRPYCICVTKAQYDIVTAGLAVPASKEEWDAQQNALAK